MLHVTKRYHSGLAPVWKSRNRWWKTGYALTVQDLEKNHDSERFPCCCHSHETFHEISKHNNHNNTRQSLHPHPLTSAVRQLPSAAVSRPLRSPAWLPSPGSRFRLSIKSSRLEDASERGIAWLTESGLVCDRLRSLAIACDHLLRSSSSLSSLVFDGFRMFLE